MRPAFGTAIARPTVSRVLSTSCPRADHAPQLLRQVEDPVRVVEDRPPEVGQHEPPAAPQEERVAQLLLELLHLGTDGGRAQVQPIGGARDSALPGHRPEVQQVVEVQVLQGHPDLPRPAGLWTVRITLI